MLLLGNLVLLPALRRRIPSSLALQRFAICAMAIPGFALFPLAAACCAGDDGAATLAVLPVLARPEHLRDQGHLREGAQTGRLGSSLCLRLIPKHSGAS